MTSVWEISLLRFAPFRRESTSRSRLVSRTRCVSELCFTSLSLSVKRARRRRNKRIIRRSAHGLDVSKSNEDFLLGEIFKN